MDWFVWISCVSLASASIDSVELIKSSGSVHDLKVNGNFEGGSSSFYLVSDEMDSEKVPCRYDGGLMAPAGLVLPDFRKRVWSINQNLVHTYEAPKRFRTTITCTAHLTSGKYLIAQGHDVCLDRENCQVHIVNPPTIVYKAARGNAPVFTSISPDRVSLNGGGLITIHGEYFGRDPAYNNVGDTAGNGFKVLFVSADGVSVLNGVIIEHMHRNNYHLVEVPVISHFAEYYETQLYHLNGGKWDRVIADCGGCNLYLRSDKTPTVNRIFPGNAMNIFQGGFWSSWKSLDSPNDNDDHEELWKRLNQEWYDLNNFCLVPVAIEARRKDTKDMAQDTDQVFRYFNAEEGFLCYGEDQVVGESKGQCYDYEVRYFCERGLRLTGQLFTGRYGDENEQGNRLRGPAEFHDGGGFTLANCDYIWRNGDDDTIHNAFTSDKRAVCNVQAQRPERAIGHYHFGTQTYDEGRGRMHSHFNYIGPAPEYKWFDFTLHGEISNVSPNVGSVGGGQLITVTGKGLNSNSEVSIGHVKCITKSFNATSGEIVCVTPSDITSGCTQTGDFFAGARGLLLERYELGHISYNSGEWQNFGTALQTWLSDGTNYNEESMPTWMNRDHYQLRLSGYFVPPLSGYYSFHGNSDDYGELMFSEVPESTCGEVTLESLWKSSCCSYTDPNNGHNKISRKLLLEKGKHYAIEYKYGENNGGAFYNVGFVYHGINEAYNMASHGPLWQNHQNSPGNCMDEKQQIKLVSHEQRENIAMKVEGDMQIEFKLKWCNDDNVCKVSTAMKSADSQDVYRNTVQDLLNSKVSYSGSFVTKFSANGDTSDNYPAHDGQKYYWWRHGWKIMKNQDINFQTDGTHVCMAYKANKQGFVRVHYTHNKSQKLNDPNVPDDEEDWRRGAHKDYPMAEPNGFEWTFFCIEIFQEVNKELRDNDYVDKIDPDIKLNAIELRGGDSWFAVDSFMVGKSNNYAEDSREAAIIPNVWIKALRNEAKANDIFNIEMIERTCGFQIPDFEVMPVFPATASNTVVNTKTVKVTNVDGIDVDGTKYSIAYDDGGETLSGSITVYENKKVSPGVTGTYTLTMGHLGSVVLDVEDSKSTFQTKVQNAFGLLFERVEKWGDCNTGFEYRYESATCDDYPAISATNTGLSRPELEPQTYNLRHGGIWIKSIPGNYLRQRTASQQISVHDPVTNIPAVCNGDCSYTYGYVNVPTVTTVTPAAFNGGSQLTIDGKNFDVQGGVSVDVGGVECAIDSINPDHTDINGELFDQIICTLVSLSLPGGAVPVTVASPLVGNSVPNDKSIFTVAPGIVSVIPATGSEFGGQLITIDGVGLRGQITVFMNDKQAELVGDVSSSDSAILVRTVAGTGPVEFKITSDILSSTFDATGYTYLAANEVLAIADETGAPADKLSLAGNTTVTLNIATSNGETDLTIFYPNGEKINAIAQSVGTVSFNTLSRPIGMYSIQARSDEFGFLKPFDISYELTVLEVTSEWGNAASSAVGGTNMKIVVENSAHVLTNANINNVNVMYGSKECPVTSIGVADIECRLPSMSDLHNINLDITTQNWAIVDAVVYQYDTITWNWAFSLQSGTPVFTISQTDAGGNIVSPGFETETVTGNLGSISMLVNLEPGKYTYTSGLVDNCCTEFAGSIEVLPTRSWILPVSLTLGGHAANYDGLARRKGMKKAAKGSRKLSGSKSERKMRNDCTPEPFDAAIGWQNLVVTVVDESVPTKMSYKMDPDWTPRMSAVTQVAEDTFDISASPVPADDCELNYQVIAIPPHSCIEPIAFEVTKVTQNNIRVKMQHSVSHSIGEEMEFILVQNGRGAARNTEGTFKVKLDPVITSVNLEDSNGNRHLSTSGGSRIVVSGKGLSSDRILELTSAMCTIESYTDTEIVCRANPSQHGQQQTLEFEYHLSDCQGGSSIFTLTSDVTFTTVAALQLDMLLESSALNFVSNQVILTLNCTANCATLFDDLTSKRNFDLSMTQNEQEIGITNTVFSISPNPPVEAQGLLTVQFDVGEYGPGPVVLEFTPHYQHGNVVPSDLESAQLFVKLEKVLPIASVDFCYLDGNCQVAGFSVSGGALVEVTFGSMIPDDLQISILENDVDLCTNANDQCELNWEVNSTTASFIVPPSIVNPAADSTAKLGFSANMGSFVYAPDYNIVYKIADTPSVDSLAPSQASYAGGDTITLSGSGFAEASDGLSMRGKRKKKNQIYYHDETARNLACDHLSVMIGTAQALILSCTDTVIEARLPYSGAGTASISVFVDGVGYATKAQSITDLLFAFKVTEIAPLQGSLGGGTLLTIKGTGLSMTTVINICGKPCTNFNEEFLNLAGIIICETPEFDANSMVSPCTIEYRKELARGKKRNDFEFNFETNLTPTILSMSHSKGGTAGGTLLTVTGVGFGNDHTKTTVTISDTEVMPKLVTGQCTIDPSQSSDSQIVCLTSKSEKGSMKAKVLVSIDGKGLALGQSDTVNDFWYIDRYSSPYTWGCNNSTCLPTFGDIVVVGEGQTLLLDQTTPILAVLLVDGGTLVWERKAGITLHAQYIIVTKNGHFEIGTEDDPFCGVDDNGDRLTAEIVMYGHHRSIRLPIYGAKVFAARSGTVDMHGCPVVTWTQLARTANAGDSVIQLEADISQGPGGGWQVGDHIVIATTGPRLTMTQSEHVEIAGISADGTTLTLNRTLNFDHLSVESTWEGANGPVLLEQKAEVGLLTRNVKFRGHNNEQWIEELPECETEYESDENAVQNCFLNKFNDEVGNDKFGGHMIFHKVTYGKLSYCEFSHTGQGFNLGRYSMHFHMSDRQPDSYFKGMGVHHTFNRAMTIHGTFDALFEWNVAYRCEGHNFFIEDGFEENNTIQYNLGIFARPSSSMLNTDQRATTFWVTNTNNIIQHNHAAGGANFGFWINPPPNHHHGECDWFIKEGYTRCPRNRKIGKFFNNTAHSMGEYGFWVFEEYVPSASDCGGVKGGGTQHIFDSPVAWGTKRGFEIASAGNGVQIWNGVFSDNTISNFAFMESRHELFGELSYGMKDGISIGYSNAHASFGPQRCTEIGLETPWEVGSMDVDGIRFFNFDQNKCKAIDACYGSDDQDCGFTAEFRRVKYFKSPNRFRAKWPYVTILQDTDGTLTAPLDAQGNGGEGHGRALGKPGSKVVASAGFYDQNKCADGTGGGWSRGAASSVCDPDVAFHRFGLNGAMSATKGRNLNMTTIHGNSKGLFRACRSTHAKGWMVILPTNEETYIHWDGLAHVNNISYSANVYDVGPTKQMWVSHEIQRVDYTTGLGTEVEGKFPQPGDGNKAYGYSDENLTVGGKPRLSIMFDRNDCVSGSNRASTPNTYCDNAFTLRTYKCFWENCIPPSTEPPTTVPTQDTCRWSMPECWESGVPPQGSNVTIQQNVRMLVDVANIEVDMIFAEGGLVFDELTTLDYKFTARSIITNTGGGNHLDMIGRSMQNSYRSVSAEERGLTMMSDSSIKIGTADNPWPCDGKVEIMLTGDKWQEEVGAPSAAVTIGAKAIAALGGLEMHGCPVANTRAYLKNTVTAGISTIRTDIDTEWKAGDRIFIAPTSFDMRESEEFLIQSITGDSITLDAPIKFTHLGKDETTTLDYGSEEHFGAEIGLLTRNIVIDGSDQDEKIFGGRIVVMRSKEGDVARYGHGQFSNVEFRHMGQFGYEEEDDRRSPIFLWGLQDAGIEDENYKLKKSYIKDCAFHKCWNSAIGSKHTFNFEVSGNVIYDVVTDAIILNGASEAVVKNNLISRVVFPPLHDAQLDFFSEIDEELAPAGIEITEATDVVLEGNIVAGSDGPCYQTSFESCSTSEQCSATSQHSSKRNTGHTCLRGVHYKGGDACVKISNFKLWKNVDFCIFMHSSGAVIADDNLCVDNFNGIFGWTFGSNPISHHIDDKHVTYKNIIIDSWSAMMTCDDIDIRSQAEVLSVTPKSRAFTSPSGGGWGVITPDNTMKGHKWPGKPIYFAETYASLHGGSCLFNVDFRNYGRHCSKDFYAIGSNAIWPDHKHMMEMTSCSYSGDAGNEIFLDRPKLKWVSVGDCVDMDCDGIKRSMVVDIDGSFFGQPMTFAIAQSEYHYEQWVPQPPHYYQGQSNLPANEDWPVSNPSRGLGDFRIPKTMVSELDGTRIPYPDYAPTKGTFRGNNCNWNAASNVWMCSNANHAQILFESFDHDSSTRRVAPIGMRQNEDKIIDLSNGVLDSSCCFGYACLLRLTQNYFNIECGHTYQYHTTGTLPKKTRFHLLGLKSTNQDCKVRVELFTFRQNRQMIYLNNVYQDSNQQLPNGEWKFPDDNLKPALSEPAGSNYFQRMEQVVYFIMNAGDIVDVKISDTIILELEVVTEMTVDQFWDSSELPKLLAVMLGISPSKIKLMNVIAENSRRRRSPYQLYERHRRAGGTITAVLEAGNMGARSNTDREEAINIGKSILDAMNSGELDTITNTTVTSLAMAIPPEDAKAPDWFDPVNNDSNFTLATQMGLPENSTLEEVTQAVINETGQGLDDLETFTEATADENSELESIGDLITYEAGLVPHTIKVGEFDPTKVVDGQVIDPPIVLRAYTSDDKVIDGPVEIAADPWKVNATLVFKKGRSGVTLSGDTQCSFDTSGKCTFSNLVANGLANNVGFAFNVVYPVTANVPSIQSNSFSVLNTSGQTLSTTTTKATTTTRSTLPYPKDMPCSNKKGKKFDCSSRNMHDGSWMVDYVMKMPLKDRSKVKSLDISKNANLPFQNIMAIIGHFPNLSSLTARFNGWKIIPANFFVNNRKVKSLDISSNDIQCLRGVFKNMKMKKMSFGDNAKLQAAVGAKKGKKSKLLKYLETFAKMPKEWCETNLHVGEESVLPFH